jgi:hypothetical protein
MKKFLSFFFIISTLTVFIVVLNGHKSVLYGAVRRSNNETVTPEAVIMEIYDEVWEMGQREGEDFLKREFHFDLDGRRENREEHILVLSYFSRRQQIFSIQITYYEDEGSKNYQGLAKDIKDIDCLITDDTAEIKECSYSQEEMKVLLPQILEGIKKEKELLKLIREPE